MSHLPPNAIPIWTDGTSLFASYHGPSGPVILRYALTQHGLLSALGLVRTRALDTLDRSAAIEALTRRTISERPRPNVPLEQSLRAREVFRKLGIVK